MNFSHLLGMISMVDILYHLRPPFMNYELGNVQLWEGELEVYLDHFTDLRVEQVMNSPVITVTPRDDLMVVIDRMVKSGIRRLPVGGRAVRLSGLSISPMSFTTFVRPG